MSFYLTPELNFSLEKKIFFSTKYNEVNLRNGPGTNHLILYKILKKGYPVLVEEEFENWKRILDFENRSGWIANSQLTKNKYGILVSNSELLKKFPINESKHLAILKKGVVFEILVCKKDWCKIKIRNEKGWVRKTSYWGSKQ